MINFNKKRKKGVAYTENIHVSEERGKIMDDPRLLEERAQEKEGKRILHGIKSWIIATCFFMLFLTQGLGMYWDSHYNIMIFGGDKTVYMVFIGLLWAIPALALIMVKGVRGQVIGTAVYGSVMWLLVVFVKGLFGIGYNLDGIVTRKAWITITYIMDHGEVKEYTEREVFPNILTYLRENAKVKDLDIWGIMDEVKEKVNYEGITTMRGCIQMVDNVISKILPTYEPKPGSRGFFGTISDVFTGAGTVIYNHPIMSLLFVGLSLVLMAKWPQGDNGAINALLTYTDKVKTLSTNISTEVTNISKVVDTLQKDVEDLNKGMEFARKRNDLSEERLETLEEKLAFLAEVTGLNAEAVKELRTQIGDLLKNVRQK
jgi:hypothetical protein